MSKWLITRRDGKILSALWSEQKIVEFRAEEEDTLAVGDLFLGRVQNVVKNLGAAFVEIAPGSLCFMPIPVGITVRQGDEIPVQVIREAVSTKAPVVTMQPSFAGKYLVLITDRSQVAVSSKIRSTTRKNELRKLLEPYLPAEASEKLRGFIVRTNAESASDSEITTEAERLIEHCSRILEAASFRTVYSRLMSGSPAWLTALRDFRTGTIQEIVTDQKDLYDRMVEMSAEELSGASLRLYEDQTVSLSSVYRIEHFLTQALSRKVWLKSGGYLIIDPTEAMTVIDINSGKYDEKKNREQAFLKINKEAAEEIAFQMRLRNLAGIILIDFIDMAEDASLKELTDTFRRALAKDPIKSTLVDFTALNLAEVTRKKVRRSLREQLRGSNRPDV